MTTVVLLLLLLLPLAPAAAARAAVPAVPMAMEEDATAPDQATCDALCDRYGRHGGEDVTVLMRPQSCTRMRDESVGVRCGISVMIARAPAVGSDCSVGQGWREVATPLLALSCCSAQSQPKSNALSTALVHVARQRGQRKRDAGRGTARRAFKCSSIERVEYQAAGGGRVLDAFAAQNPQMAQSWQCDPGRSTYTPLPGYSDPASAETDGASGTFWVLTVAWRDDRGDVMCAQD